MDQKPIRPTVFVGSSSEGLPVAKAVQSLLDPACEVELWTQGTFGLSRGTLESLVLATDRFDFAVLVVTPDDLVTTRGVERPAARDNVLFELGLFIGAIGRDRTFVLHDRVHPPALPSDLAGITAATFEPHASGNLEAALGAPCTRIENAIRRAGIRESRRAQRLDSAGRAFAAAESQMSALVALLARSRKVELDIISAQFGPLIDPKNLNAIKADLADLDAILRSRGA